MDLADLGWTPARSAAFGAWGAQGMVPARVLAEHTHVFRLASEAGEVQARVSGRMRHAAAGRSDFPATGDWVAISPGIADGDATIHAILPRRSRFSRKVAGAETEEQVVAANIDTVFLVCGLDGDFNPRRIERALVLAWDSGAAPVVILSKADLCTEVDARVHEVEGCAPGVAIHAISSLRAEGVAAVLPYLIRGRTIALLGSSGVGKSTLINRLLGGDAVRTAPVGAGDDRGQHTTTHRELHVLPQGGLVIDTPGLRELQLWGGEDAGLDAAFADIVSLGAGCRFRDCGHEAEPGCAVRAALASGQLAADRWESYAKLQREMRSLEARRDARARSVETQRVKTIMRAHRGSKKRP